MADVSILQVSGIDYTIKDSTARATADSADKKASTASETATEALNIANGVKDSVDVASQNASDAKANANSALSKANANATDIANLEGKTLSVSYVAEKITFTKGV